MTPAPFPPRDVHYSALKKMQASPAHFRSGIEYPTFDPWSPAMRFGTLVHAIILGGHFVVWNGKRDNSKAWKAFKAQHDGSPIVTHAEYTRAAEIAEAVKNDPVAPPLLVGKREIELEWEVMGRRCAGRLDVLNPHFITDVKTSAKSAPGWFRFQALRMGYPTQLAWYREGARQNGYAIDITHIVAIETRRPYAVTCFRPTERALEEGERIWRLWMEQLLVCEASDEWPAYAQTVVELDVPEAEPDLIFGDEDDDESEAA